MMILRKEEIEDARAFQEYQQHQVPVDLLGSNIFQMMISLLPNHGIQQRQVRRGDFGTSDKKVIQLQLTRQVHPQIILINTDLIYQYPTEK